MMDAYGRLMWFLSHGVDWNLTLTGATVILTALTLLIVLRQLAVMRSQSTLMQRQTALMQKQAEIEARVSVLKMVGGYEANQFIFRVVNIGARAANGCYWSLSIPYHICSNINGIEARGYRTAFWRGVGSCRVFENYWPTPIYPTKDVEVGRTKLDWTGGPADIHWEIVGPDGVKSGILTYTEHEMIEKAAEL
jgi:hypothetical protein